MMRILFLSNFYPPYELGGYEQWCQEVATRLEERGYELAVLTSRYGTQAEAGNDAPEITRSLYLQTDVAYYRPADFFMRRSYQERANLQALRQKIDQFQPDIIMVWGMWNLSHNLPYWAEQWLPGRVAFFISNYWAADVDPHTAFWRLPTRKPIMEVIKRPLSALALSKLQREGYPPQLRLDHAVCCSEYVRDSLVTAGKLPAHAGVLYGGTDPEPFLKHSRLNGNYQQQERGTLRLLYFGRLIHDKGVHTAVEALGRLKEQGLAAGLELTILGSGHPDYERELRELVVQLDIADQVNFVNQVSRDKVPEWLGRFDIFLFTSIWPEPMARSVMEAMAAGLLVIGTEVGGQVEMLSHGQNALTFKVEDVATLADRIASVADDPPLRARLARAGQQLVLERFTLRRMVDEIEQYLRNVVKNAPPLTS